jgi:hypothetical protein
MSQYWIESGSLECGDPTVPGASPFGGSTSKTELAVTFQNNIAEAGVHI